VMCLDSTRSNVLNLANYRYQTTITYSYRVHIFFDIEIDLCSSGVELGDEVQQLSKLIRISCKWALLT